MRKRWKRGINRTEFRKLMRNYMHSTSSCRKSRDRNLRAEWRNYRIEGRQLLYEKNTEFQRSPSRNNLTKALQAVRQTQASIGNQSQRRRTMDRRPPTRCRMILEGLSNRFMMSSLLLRKWCLIRLSNFISLPSRRRRRRLNYRRRLRNFSKWRRRMISASN